MSKNLILEIPETDAAAVEALLDELNETLRRIEQEAPGRDAEHERLQAEGRVIMQDVWKTIEHVEKTL